ncbi:polyprenyl synthetase family protein [Anaerococcus jeddahensis]|uniref:polyprenyl synthetase family protein n=1 Tax=Anaerococcus jeddahensis TaxID=1673719 RepID=UPI001FD7C4E4|nr:polyprenyl synthetase family protein [Anaerococcus jeddahensis]
MNKEVFDEILINDKKLIDKAMAKKFEDDNPLKEALIYASDSGKRIRPVVFLETIKMLLGEEVIDEKIIDFALSLEMVHAYSLVHDDMPCMDNDDYRRGKLTVHKKFGEDLAVLVGDSLLSFAFENVLALSIYDQRFLLPGKYLARACGKDGMIKGQVFDIKAKKNADSSYVLDVYKNKTARLFMAALVMAGLYAKVSDEKIKKLEDYAYYLGLSFQLQDDILDKYDEIELNILSCISMDEAKKLLLDFNKKAKENIKDFKDNDFHIYLIDYLTERIK